MYLKNTIEKSKMLTKFLREIDVFEIYFFHFYSKT